MTSYDLTQLAQARIEIDDDSARRGILPVPLAANITRKRRGGSMAAGSYDAGAGGTGTPGPGGTTTTTPLPLAPKPPNTSLPPAKTLPGQAGLLPILARDIFNAHISQETAGGVALHEIRAYGPISRPFAIRKVLVSTPFGATTGQYLDILISGDTTSTDTAYPTGQSIFTQLLGSSSINSPDAERGLPLITSPYDFEDPFFTLDPYRTIKLHVYAIAPAITIPTVHIMIIVDELGTLDDTQPQQIIL